MTKLQKNYSTKEVSYYQTMIQPMIVSENPIYYQKIDPLPLSYSSQRLITLNRRFKWTYNLGLISTKTCDRPQL